MIYTQRDIGMRMPLAVVFVCLTRIAELFYIICEKVMRYTLYKGLWFLCYTYAQPASFLGDSSQSLKTKTANVKR